MTNTKKKPKKGGKGREGEREIRHWRMDRSRSGGETERQTC